MQLFDPFFYEKAHLLVVLFLSLYFTVVLSPKNAEKVLHRKKSLSLVYIYAILFIVAVGFRPISAAFGDTVNYARTYNSFSRISEGITSSKDSFFYSFMWLCSQFMSVNWFFFIIEILYILPIVWGCYRLMHNNADIGLIFCFAAFSFFTYGVNGLRNGVALSFVFLAMTFMKSGAWNIIICAILSLLGIAFHASAALPVICMIAAFFIRKPKWFFYFWALSILISLLAGNAVANIFAGLGFDDRLSDYILVDVDENMFSRVGFRWDFLLYSAMPIILGWYIINKKKVINKSYILLLGTYILANAFWIMVIRAEYSNRFAYLSWFLYPVVLAYPLLKLKIWPKSQGRKTAIIMMAHLAFTLVMAFFV